MDVWRVADCNRIVQAFADRGYQISFEQAKEAWESFSDSQSAVWLFLPDDDSDVFQSVLEYFEEEQAQ